MNFNEGTVHQNNVPNFCRSEQWQCGWERPLFIPIWIVCRSNEHPIRLSRLKTSTFFVGVRRSIFTNIQSAKAKMSVSIRHLLVCSECWLWAKDVGSSLIWRLATIYQVSVILSKVVRVWDLSLLPMIMVHHTCCETMFEYPYEANLAFNSDEPRKHFDLVKLSHLQGSCYSAAPRSIKY